MKKLMGIVAVLIGISALAWGDDAPKANKADEAKKPAVYDEKANAKELIAAALASAKAENRRVLIQWGGNWCSWCMLLHERFRSDRELAKELRYEYDAIYIDSKNAELMKEYKVDGNEGVPYLTILDSNGKVLINQSSVPFETKVDGKNGHDPKKLLAFLQTHRAPPLEADAVLRTALAKATESNRRVFLHFGAPWCGWCLKLDAWLARPEIAKVFGKDYVDVKIDVDRMAGAKEVLALYNSPDSNGTGKPSGGIPWFAILDAKAKVLATSDGPKGNIGFPSTEDEIVHFVKMLNASKQLLTDADIDVLRTSLAAKKPSVEK